MGMESNEQQKWDGYKQIESTIIKIRWEKEPSSLDKASK